MKKIKLNKNYSLFALVVSFFVLKLFLLLGLILTAFFLRSMLTGFSGIGLSSIMFFLVGIYLIFRPITYIRILIKNKNNFNSILNKFINNNKIAVILTCILSVILLSLFYSNIYLNFDFFVNVVLYLPIFLIKNLTFLVNISLIRYKLMFLSPLVGLVLPISEVIFLFFVSKFFAKFFKHKR